MFGPCLSTGIKIGYTWVHWRAAQSDTGPQGWPMGLTYNALHGLYCGWGHERGGGKSTPSIKLNMGHAGLATGPR